MEVNRGKGDSGGCGCVDTELSAAEAGAAGPGKGRKGGVNEGGEAMCPLCRREGEGE
jgi:hypothetical protein